MSLSGLSINRECKTLTAVIHIILALRDPLSVHYGSRTRVLSNIAVAFTEDDNLVTRNIVHFDGFPDDALADAVRVDVRCIPSVKPTIVGSLKNWKRLSL